MARRLYVNEPFGVDLKDTVYALDATTINLCLSVFPWAPFRSTKAAIKLHTLLDLRGNIPSFIRISDGKWHEVNVLDELITEPGAFYVMDRGYIDFERLGRLSEAGSFFVTRAKSNLKVQRRYSRKVDKNTGLICDQTVMLTVFYSRQGFDAPLRRIKFKDPVTGKTLVFLTNNFVLPALTITHSTASLADRVVLQVDQAASAYQSFLWHHRKRGQNSNLDRDIRLRAHGHHQKTTQLFGQSLQLLQILSLTLLRGSIAGRSPSDSSTCSEQFGWLSGAGLRRRSKTSALGSTRSGQFQGSIAALNRESPSGLYVTVGPLIPSNGKQIADFATKGKLPSIQTSRAGIDAGGLMYRGDGSQSKLFSLLYPPNE